MKSSLFKKLFITYGVTIIISFGILALLLLRLFDQYFIETKKQLLMEQSKEITLEVANSLFVGQLNQNRLSEDLRILDKFLDAKIWVVDENGVIYGVSEVNEDNYLGQKIDGSKQQLLRAGSSIYERGNFGGMLTGQSLIVGYPIFYGGTFKGSVIVHASLPEVKKTFRDIYQMTLWAIILSGIIAYILLYIQIKKISTPLKEIAQAARIIAGGEFQKRLQIDTKDEIEELSKSFNHMAESLEKIEENRRNLIANISHDLRSPMTTIRGFIEGILDGTIPQEKHQYYLDIVLTESKRLIKITNDLLELSSIQQGEVVVRKASFELNEIIRQKLLSYEQQITKKKLNVKLILCDDHTNVYADASLTERVLSNLLDNAIKFTPEKEQIIIKTINQNDKIWIEITNTGVSISEDELKKIWERFHKGDVSRGEHKSGFGLGLSIVMEMLNLQEEKIWVNSKDQKVTFTFTITKTL